MSSVISYLRAEPQVVTFTIPLSHGDEAPSQYIVKVISERSVRFIRRIGVGSQTTSFPGGSESVSRMNFRWNIFYYRTEYNPIPHYSICILSQSKVNIIFMYNSRPSFLGWPIYLPILIVRRRSSTFFQFSQRCIIMLSRSSTSSVISTRSRPKYSIRSITRTSMFFLEPLQVGSQYGCQGREFMVL